MEGDDGYCQQSDSIKEQEDKVKRGLIWTVGGVGLAALLGLVNTRAVVSNITDGGGEGGVGGGPTGTEQLPAGGTRGGDAED